MAALLVVTVALENTNAAINFRLYSQFALSQWNEWVLSKGLVNFYLLLEIT